ncbi:hypothetical protein IW261DRAFT_1476619 [Armillaria novae-zelandiae]|uniref:BZIP domain-containing protein n=1 Tax=Armillaria novae-zelandiae TaxID=153914 RepID=A0AA39PAR3_9AGAR|nr:hypothetical protein IW261DRAFT_1476619 [Armillaria novae-zelandiae]
MTKANSESSSSRAARVRENQRQSRQRKRDYVSSLEQRLETFEKEGVKANVELQKVARAVSAENQKLRALLIERSGMSEADIQQHLREGSVSSTEASPSPPSCSPCSCVCIPASSKCSESSAAAVPESSNASATVTDVASFNPSPSTHFDLSLNFLNDIAGLGSEPIASSSTTLQFPAPETSASLHPRLPPFPCTFAQMPDDPNGVLSFLFDSSSFEPPISSFTDCDVAYRLIKTLNRRRKVKMDMVDIVLRWLWSGFRAANGPACCVIDDEVLCSTVVNLIVE